MKPSTPTPTSKTPSQSSSSSSKSKSPNKVKKSNSVSKSKSKKSSSGPNLSNNNNMINNTSVSNQQLTVQANLNHLNSHEHASPNSSSRGNYQKTYVGVNAKTVKCIWEQHDTTEMELNAEILPVLAEDASYRLYELANNLKTFTRHSGGKLTTDIVNEVLKDCDVPPVIGARAGNSDWNRIDYDGTYFFHIDEIIDLRDEYLKDISSIQCGPLSLECNWVTNQRNHKDLTKLWKSIILAIIMGDDAAFQYTIHTTLINPYIGCILPYLIQKTIEYLSFGCPEDTLDRLLRFLKVIAQNYHCRDVANNEEYFNLCNLFVCLLLGPIDVKTKLENIKSKQIKREKEERRQNSDGEYEEDELMKSSIGKSCVKEELTNDSKMNYKHVVKDECENSNDAYTSSKLVVNPLALGIKKEISTDSKPHHHFNFDSSIKFEPHFYDMDFQHEHLFNGEETDAQAEMNLKQEKYLAPEKALVNECFSSFYTEMCDDRYIEDVCTVIGYLASKWGYFEHEIIYLLVKRLEIFFDETTSWSITEFKWLMRVVQALTSLGDVAFRELTIYFEYIPYDQIPEWLKPHFNYAAIYLRGSKDLYFYEYMQELCGDGLLPFMLFYSSYMEKLLQKSLKLKKLQQQKPLKISSKFLLKSICRQTPPISNNMVNCIDTIFPERAPIIKTVSSTIRKIGFKFAGCCPVLAKPKNRPTAHQQFVQSNELRKTFNSKIVVCRRKLLKTICINDYPPIGHLIDNRWFNI